MTEPGGVDPPEPVGPASIGAVGRIGRGLAANLTGNGVTLLIQLVSVPVFLAAWGVSTYGEWLILSAIPTYLALSDLSFATVAGNSMVMLTARGDREAATTIGRRVWSIATIMTGAVVLAAVAIALVAGSLVGKGTAIPAAEAQVVLVALFLQVGVGNQFAMLDVWYRTGGRYPLGIALRQVARLLEFGALMTAVLLGGRPSIAAIAFLLGSAVGFGLSWLVLRRAVPWASFRPEAPRMQTFRELFAPGVAFISFPLSNALSIQGFTIVVGGTLGAAAVVVWSTTRTVTRVAIQIMSSVNLSIWPELSRSIGTHNLAEARSILRRAVQLSLVASLSLLVVLVALGPSAIRWWTHGVIDPPVALLDVLLLVVVANSLWWTLTTALAATNRHTRMAIVYLASTIVAVLLAIPLSSKFGLLGAGIALLAIDIGMVLYVLPATLAIVQDSPASFLRALLDLRGALRFVSHMTDVSIRSRLGSVARRFGRLFS